MTCFLNSLTSSRLDTALPYLKIGKGFLDLDRKKISCCEGDGIRLSSKSSTTVLSCDLKKRKRDLEVILGAFEQTWNASLEPCVFETKDFQLYWNWLILYKHRKIFKGFLIETNLNEKQESLAWSLAAMATWRVGLKSFVFNLKRHNIQWFIQQVHQAEDFSPIVFLEIEEGLWSLQKRENIAYIVSWCEKHLWPLWIINKGTKEKSLNQSSSVMKMFEKKINNKKQKHFTQWLEKETLSKLSTLCIKSSVY